MTMKGVKDMADIWYAIMLDKEDQDWGTGSFDKHEAMVRASVLRDSGHPDAYIAVIDDTNDPVCIDEIHDF